MTFDKPVLVTGATGFIGSRAVARLLNEGASVRAFVLPNESTQGLWSGHVDVVVGDIADAKAVARAVEGCGTVIHLAAVVADWGPETLFERVTVGGTRHVLDAALQQDAKVVVVSSVVYYGSNLPVEVCHEDCPPGEALGVYSRSKQRQEEVTREFMAKGVRAVIVRPTNVYGADSGPWVNDLIDVLKQGIPALIGGGRKNAGLVHVQNVVDVLLKAAENPIADGKAYNACDDLDVTWKRYMTDIAKIGGASRPKSIPWGLAKSLAYVLESIWSVFGIDSRPPITHEALNLVGSHHRVPNTRARDELNHVSTMTYEEGLKEVIERFEKLEV